MNVAHTQLSSRIHAKPSGKVMKVLCTKYFDLHSSLLMSSSSIRRTAGPLDGTLIHSSSLALAHTQRRGQSAVSAPRREEVAIRKSLHRGRVIQQSLATEPSSSPLK